jgi:cell division protein FtsI/penicillin-binding protein 2
VPEATAIEINRLIEKAKRDKIVFTTKAVRFEQDFVRSYPNGTMLCHVLGFVNEEGQGVEGIEASMNQALQGEDGYRFIERDRTDHELVPYRGETKAPRDGRTVRLTIDMSLQAIVESELDAAVHQFKPKKATIIMMNPKTGDLMAMANRPNFDPNPARDAHGKPTKSAVPDTPKEKREFLERRKNIAITDQVEPGSTFKIVAASAALSEGIVRPDTEIFCENGHWSWCKLGDHHPYGSLTVQDILVKSSNIGAAKLGIQLGDQRFYEYVRKFGFGEKTSVNLPGEIRGQVLLPYNWDKLTITRMPMGQSIAATPLQITNAMCTIANGGTLMFPQIVREIIHEGGSTTYPPREMRRVVSKKATEAVREALIRVVSPKGTAALGRVAGFKVAGKTGTAQKRDEHGKMAHDEYVVSFVGFLPAEDPAFVILVLLDEAQTKPNENYGGLVAAPIFSRVAEKAARYLNLQPTEENLPPGSVISRNDRNDSIRAARDQ